MVLQQNKMILFTFYVYCWLFFACLLLYCHFFRNLAVAKKHVKDNGLLTSFRFKHYAARVFHLSVLLRAACSVPSGGCTCARIYKGTREHQGRC